VVVTGAIAIFFSARVVRRSGRSPEFRAGALFARFGVPVAWLRRRIQRGDRDERAAHGGGATARVLVRTADGAELHVPVHNSQLSVGASPQCDVTLSGAEVRFVHMILTNVGRTLTGCSASARSRASRAASRSATTR